MSPAPVQAPRPARAQIVLADDHELFREGLANLINAQSDLAVAGQDALVDAEEVDAPGERVGADRPYQFRQISARVDACQLLAGSGLAGIEIERLT